MDYSNPFLNALALQNSTGGGLAGALDQLGSAQQRAAETQRWIEQQYIAAQVQHPANPANPEPNKALLLLGDDE